jgi:hypothetical protein
MTRAVYSLDASVTVRPVIATADKGFDEVVIERPPQRPQLAASAHAMGNADSSSGRTWTFDPTASTITTARRASSSKTTAWRRRHDMVVTPRSLLCAAALGFMSACGPARDPTLSAMEAAVRSHVGAAAAPRVGYILPDSTSLLVDFEAAALPDTQQATFTRTAREVAIAVVRSYPKAMRLVSVMVSAGKTEAPGQFRVLRQQTFTMAELR